MLNSNFNFLNVFGLVVRNKTFVAHTSGVTVIVWNICIVVKEGKKGQSKRYIQRSM